MTDKFRQGGKLTESEKIAGRMFRERARALMEIAFSEIGDSHVFPLELCFVRHVCPNHKGRTWAVHLREYVVFSPLMWVCYCSAVVEEPHDDCDGAVRIEEGLFGWIWRAGSCPCGYAARSAGGKIVLAADRAPLRGATEVKLDTPGRGGS